MSLRRYTFPSSCGPRQRRTSAGEESEPPPADPAAMFADMLQGLETDPLWAREYGGFVRAVSFAGPGEAIDFADALAACTRLIAVAYEGT